MFLRRRRRNISLLHQPKKRCIRIFMFKSLKQNFKRLQHTYIESKAQIHLSNLVRVQCLYGTSFLGWFGNQRLLGCIISRVDERIRNSNYLELPPLWNLLNVLPLKDGHIHGFHFRGKRSTFSIGSELAKVTHRQWETWCRNLLFHLFFLCSLELYSFNQRSSVYRLELMHLIWKQPTNVMIQQLEVVWLKISLIQILKQLFELLT